jgi:hypothetical protein
LATFGEDTSGRGGANNSGQSSGIFNGGYGAFAQLVFNTVGYTAARALGNGTKGDASSWNYAVTLAFPDLGKKGNLGGIVVGMQPKLTGTSNDVFASAIGLPIDNGVQQRSDRDTGFHVEAFYRYQLTENISITPGAFWLTAPNHDERNPDVVIGAIRTTFSF